MNKFLLATFAMLCFYATSNAQMATLRGKVLDAKTNEPMFGLSVIINEGQTGVVTDFDGKFSIDLKPGTYNIIYSYIGYEKLDTNITLAANQVFTIDIKVKEIVQQMATVVISASRYARDVREETVSMEVIPKSFIANNTPSSMDQIMNRVPGVNIVDGQANIRAGSGFTYGAGSRVAILVDGLPLSTADAGDTKWSFMPIENVEQVEVIKGAASAVYGSSAMNGVINFRSAYPTSTPETKLILTQTVYGNTADSRKAWWLGTATVPNESQLAFAHKQKFKQFDLVVGANYFTTTSFRKGSDETRGRVNFNTRYRIKQIAGLAVGINLNYQRGINGSFFIWENGIEGAYKASAISSNINYSTRFTFDPFIDYFTKSGHSFSIKTRYFNSNNVNNNNQTSRPNVYYSEFNWNKSIDKLGLNFVAGAVNQIGNVKSVIYGDHESTNTAGFGQVDYKLKRIRLNFTLGARYEIFSVDSVNGKSGLLKRFGVSKTLGKATFLRASYGEGYRFPTIAEKFIETNVGIGLIPNAKLQPESGWNAEFGVKQGVKINNWEMLIDVAAYWQEYNTMMEFNYLPSGDFQSQNIGDTRIAGSELSIMGQGKIGACQVQFLAGVNYALPFRQYEITKNGNTFDTTDITRLEYFAALKRNIIKTDKDDLKNIMFFRNSRTAKCDLNVIYKKCTIGGAMQYVSLMERINNELLAFIPGVYEYILERKNGDIIFDFRLGYQVNKNLMLNVNVKNCFNRFYYFRPAFAEGPRNYTLNLNYKF